MADKDKTLKPTMRELAARALVRCGYGPRHAKRFVEGLSDGAAQALAKAKHRNEVVEVFNELTDDSGPAVEATEADETGETSGPRGED